MSRKRPASALDVTASDASLHRELVQCSSQVGLIQSMNALQRAGLLADFRPRQTRAELSAAKRMHSHQRTPYGYVVQKMDIPSAKLSSWEYCHPLALMYYLASVSASFFELMQEVLASANGPLRVIVYIDEIVPGNPFRHDQGRKLQAIYFAFAEWPAWLLSRTGAWPVFGVLRSSVVKEFPGGVSELMKLVLRKFFPALGTGIHLVSPNGATAFLRGAFGGFLADEKALKEVFDCKGASGTRSHSDSTRTLGHVKETLRRDTVPRVEKNRMLRVTLCGTLPCQSCANVLSISNRAFVADGLVCIDCADRSKFMPHTTESIYQIIDDLRAAQPGKRSQLSQTVGFNYNEHGLLQDADFRAQRLIHPTQHYLRDWMHTLVSGGQANTHTALLLHKLKANGVPVRTVQEYIIEYNLPSKHGKVSPEWLKDSLLNNKDHSQFSSFASIMLTLVPLIYAFLMDVVHPSGHLQDDIRCYGLLTSIIALLQRADTAPSNVHQFIQLVDEYGALFIRLYDRAKAKFHHMYHLHEGIVRFGRVLSCFVTERRHRSTKKAALQIFRYIEETVLKDLINRMVESFISDASLFQQEYLVTPKVGTCAGAEIQVAFTAVLKPGKLAKGDVVYVVQDGVPAACRIEQFWCRNGFIAVQLWKYTCVHGDRRYWKSQHLTSSFVSASVIVDAVAWRPDSADQIRIVPPYVSL